MTPEKLRSLFEQYAAAVLAAPKRMPEGGYDLHWRHLDDKEVFHHIAWMCQEAQTFLEPFHCGCGQEHGPDPRKIEKAMRWLGFIQGLLFVYGLRTLNELRDDSMADGKKFMTPEQESEGRRREEATKAAMKSLLKGEP